METIEVCGKTVEEAVEKGLSELGTQRENVEIEILEEPESKGFLFKKVTLAKVKLTKKPSDSKRVVDFLEGLFDLINVHATTEVVRDDDKICINLIASNSSHLIGYRGEMLDSLQCLAGAVANIGREEYKRVVVDCEQYREKREETLKNLAEKLAEKAVRTGRKISLEPMNPFERRIIHTTLSTREDVTTQSMGKEPSRYIMIVPNEIKDERPLSADRGGRGKDNGRGSYRKLDRNERGSKHERFSKGGKGGKGYKDRKSGSSEMYGKPKDKSNVTSFGTFIGNSYKNGN